MAFVSHWEGCLCQFSKDWGFRYNKFGMTHIRTDKATCM